MYVCIYRIYIFVGYRAEWNVLFDSIEYSMEYSIGFHRIFYWTRIFY